MRISDWSSDVCSSDLLSGKFAGHQIEARARYWLVPKLLRLDVGGAVLINGRFLKDAPNANGYGDVKYGYDDITARSEEHTSELQSLMRISYAVFCLKKKKTE